MVRSQAFPWANFAGATPGQITWVYLNQLVDHDERLRKIHVHCMPKFLQERCEVCHEPIIMLDDLPAEIRDKVYRPGPGENYNKVIEFQDQGERSFGDNSQQ